MSMPSSDWQSLQARLLACLDPAVSKDDKARYNVAVFIIDVGIACAQTPVKTQHVESTSDDVDPSYADLRDERELKRLRGVLIDLVVGEAQDALAWKIMKVALGRPITLPVDLVWTAGSIMLSGNDDWIPKDLPPGITKLTDLAELNSQIAGCEQAMRLLTPLSGDFTAYAGLRNVDAFRKDLLEQKAIIESGRKPPPGAAGEAATARKKKGKATRKEPKLAGPIPRMEVRRDHGETRERIGDRDRGGSGNGSGGTKESGPAEDRGVHIEKGGDRVGPGEP